MKYSIGISIFLIMLCTMSSGIAQDATNKKIENMEAAKIVEQWGEAQIQGDWDAYHALSTDDFVLIGPAPEPLDKQAFLGWLQSLLGGNTDHNNNLTVVESSGNTVKATVQMEGKHTKDWDLSFLGMGVRPATNVHWKYPKEELIVTLRDGKIAKLEVSVPENGGIAGIMSQLGLSKPVDE